MLNGAWNCYKKWQEDLSSRSRIIRKFTDNSIQLTRPEWILLLLLLHTYWREINIVKDTVVGETDIRNLYHIRFLKSTIKTKKKTKGNWRVKSENRSTEIMRRSSAWKHERKYFYLTYYTLWFNTVSSSEEGTLIWIIILDKENFILFALMSKNSEME